MHRSEHWKLGFVGSRCTACGAGQLPPQRVCSACGAVDQMRRRAVREPAVPDRHLHARPPRLLAAAADGGRGARLRGRRPARVRAHRRRAREGRDRRRARDDVPPPLHGGRESTTTSGRRARGAKGDRHGQQGHQGPRRDRGHGLHEVRRALGPGRRRPARRRGGRRLPLGGRRSRAGRRLLARHDGQRHVGPRALRGAQAPTTSR